MCRGYMAPEYVVHGKLTEKADVYSFGVVVIEVLSGKRNNAFSQNSSSILKMVVSLSLLSNLSLVRLSNLPKVILPFLFIS